MARLHIHSLTLENFKSYAGRIHIPDIRSGLVAIAGPAGSGKSNFLHAVLFVLGHSDSPPYIHHNSTSQSNFALVGVQFLSETCSFTLERTITSTNTSTYRLNGLPTTSTAVSDLLKSLQIDTEHGYFSVLQGDIERIRHYTPKDAISTHFLACFEDFIGNQKFINTEKRLKTQISQLEEQLDIALERVKAVKRKKKQAKVGAKACEEYLKVELETYKVKNVSLRLELHIQRQNLSSVLQFETEITRKYSELSSEVVDLQLHHKQYQSRLNSAYLERKSLQVKHLKLQRDLELTCVSPLTRTIAQVQTALSANQRKATELWRTKTDLEAQETGVNAAVSVGEANSYSLTSTLTALQKDLLRLDAANPDYADSKFHLYQANNLRKLTENTLTNAKAEYNSLLENINWQEQRKQSYEQQHQELTQRQNELENLKKICENALEETQIRLKNVDSNRNLAELKRNIAAKLMDSLQIDITKIEMMAKYREKSQLKGEKLSKLHQIIRLAREKGEFPNILGRLGDFAAIGGDFDTAISTVFAKELNAYVSLDVQTGEQLVDYCKARKVGPVKVYVVERVQGYAAETRYVQPEKHAFRLFDQLQVNPLQPYLKQVFYSVLQDTLVVQTLTEALHLCFHYSPRPTVVTAVGEAVRATGEIQGPAVPVTGLMLTTSPSSAPPLRHTQPTAPLLTRVTQQTHLRDELDILVNSLSLESSALSSHAASLQTQLAHFHSELSLLSFLLSPSLSPEFRLIPLHTQLTRLRSHIQTHRNSLESITSTCLQLQDDIDMQRNSAAQQIALSICQNKLILDRNQEEYLRNVQLLWKIKAKIEICNRNLMKVMEEIKGNEREIEDLTEKFSFEERNLKKKMSKLEEIETKLRELNEEINDLEGYKIETEQKISENKGKIAEFGVKLKENRREIINRQIKIAEIEAVIEENKAKYTEKLRQCNELCKFLNKEDDFFSIFSGKSSINPKYSKYFLEIHDNVPIEEWLSHSQSSSEVLTELQAASGELQVCLRLPPDLELLYAYNYLSEDFISAVAQVHRLQSDLRLTYQEAQEVRSHRQQVLRHKLPLVTTAFQRYYRHFAGDLADVAIECSNTTDIRISVQSTDQLWRSIETLSGGERTVVLLSLIFALFDYKPSGIYVLDEVDATLDAENAQKLYELVHEKSKEAQVLLTSHHISHFGGAEQFLGVYTSSATSSQLLPFTPPVS